MPTILLALVVGYLLGSLPFGYLVARARGVNIFAAGSKNPGATNVGRVCGFWWGKLVLLLDALKGAVATAWLMFHLHWTSANGSLTSLSFDFHAGDSATLNLAIAGLVGALLGHSFSCFTKFKGGKGVATGAGGMLVLMPIVALIALGVFILVRFASGYVSLASIVAAVSLPISAALRHEETVLIVVAAVIAGFVVIRHRANISRLLAGTEAKAGAKPPQS